MSGDGEFGLVMPFIVVESKGGPYADDAYTAGWEAGELWSRFHAAALHQSVPQPVTVRTTNAKQIELIAMKNGFTITKWTVEPEYGEWTTLEFSIADHPPVSESDQ